MVNKTSYGLNVLLVASATLLLQATVCAQTASETRTGPTGPTQDYAGSEVQPPSKFTKTEDGPSSQLELLRREVEQLKTLLERQQVSLGELERQLNDLKAQVGLRPSSASSAGDPTGTESEKSSAATGPVPPAATVVENQPNNQKPSLVAGWDGNHAFLRSTDGNFETFLIGYAQLDFHGYSEGNHPPNTFLIRRARLGLEGRVARYFEYRIEGDFADTSSTLLRDGYLHIHRKEGFQFTFGQFREPFSQEEIRQDANQDFLERSLVNNLAPSRQPGLMISGVLRKGVFEYQLGAFNGKGLLALNNSGTPDIAGRVRFAPWKNTESFWLKGVAFGGAAAFGHNKNGLSVRGLTESRSISFFVPETVNGPLWRANGELTWLLGPAAVRVEYDQTNQERRGLGPQGTTLPGVVAKGYMGQFTYVLTGETKPDNGTVVPKHSLFGDEKGGGFGAWELKFRYANLSISDGTPRSNRAESYYFGPNWYLNKFVRYVLDLGLERFSDPLRAPKPGERNFFVVLSRVQFSF